MINLSITPEQQTLIVRALSLLADSINDPGSADRACMTPDAADDLVADIRDLANGIEQHA
jgi:hypothetical protein